MKNFIKTSFSWQKLRFHAPVYVSCARYKEIRLVRIDGVVWTYTQHFDRLLARVDIVYDVICRHYEIICQHMKSYVDI